MQAPVICKRNAPFSFKYIYMKEHIRNKSEEKNTKDNLILLNSILYKPHVRFEVHCAYFM